MTVNSDTEVLCVAIGCNNQVMDNTANCFLKELSLFKVLVFDLL